MNVSVVDTGGFLEKKKLEYAQNANLLIGIEKKMKGKKRVDKSGKKKLASITKKDNSINFRIKFRKQLVNVIKLGSSKMVKVREK